MDKIIKKNLKLVFATIFVWFGSTSLAYIITSDRFFGMCIGLDIPKSESITNSISQPYFHGDCYNTIGGFPNKHIIQPTFETVDFLINIAFWLAISILFVIIAKIVWNRIIKQKA